ncbi:MAG: hypothetical protein AB1Z98_04215 [Nannocystaceae bacterium]
MNPLAVRVAMLCLGVAACQPLPEIEYETDNLRLATDFDAPVCAGTLRMLDRAAGRISASLDPADAGERYVVFWLEHELPDQCDDDATGCFYPGTRVVFAHGESIAHELVHATLDSPGESFFVEEGLAELFGGTPVRYDSSRLRGKLASQLALSRRAYDHGALSYSQAAHFAHWLRDAEGAGAVLRLGAGLSRGGRSVRDDLQSIFGTSLRGIEQSYEREAPRLYRGLYDDDLETLRLEGQSQWLELSLGCDDDDVIGPLHGAEEGMARVLRLEVPVGRTTRLRMDGPPGSWVELRNPYASDVRYMPPWWPARDSNGRLARIGSGELVSLWLDRGVYQLIVATTGTAPAQVDLQLLP